MALKPDTRGKSSKSCETYKNLEIGLGTLATGTQISSTGLKSLSKDDHDGVCMSPKLITPALGHTMEQFWIVDFVM